MQYPLVQPAVFASRPNRFVAHCHLADGQPVVAHVKNTGRCRELLVPGARVYLSRAQNPARKTGWDLVAVEKGALLVNLDSQAPNQVVAEALEEGRLLLPGMGAPSLVRREFAFGDSRFDLMVQSPSQRALVEVKGVTLEQQGVALFPDAPTQRGVRHLQGLCRAVGLGWRAYAVFVLQFSPAAVLRPHWERHPAFGQALLQAARAGVGVLAFDCDVAPGCLRLGRAVPVDLAAPLEGRKGGRENAAKD